MGRKWNNIKEKKAAKDANTSKIYAKFGREIYQAAKSGEPDPESNRNLKVVLERAKTYRVPKNIIDRAIEKAKGGSEENYDELRYDILVEHLHSHQAFLTFFQILLYLLHLMLLHFVES